MSKRLNVISIGYAGRLLDSSSREYTRMLSYAESLESYTMVVFTLREDDLPDYLEAGNLTIIGTNSSSKLAALYTAIKIITKLARKNKHKQFVLTAQDPFETSLVSLFVRAKNVFKHIQVHGDFYGNKWWQKQSIVNRIRAQFGMWMLRRVGHVRVVSSRIKASLVASGISEHRISVLPIRVETEQFSVRPIGGVSANPTFISVGRMATEKNLEGLLEAFTRVHAVVPNARLRLIGEGDENEVLVNRAKELGLESAVSFEGWRSDVHETLAEADVFVLSSHYEGHAMVLIEAMSAGLPIVSTDVGCVGDLVIHNQHALVAPPGDIDKLAELMHQIVTEATLYSNLQSNVIAQAALLRSQNQETYVEEWVGALEQVVPKV